MNPRARISALAALALAASGSRASAQPTQTGTAKLWVVLRDDRGGIGWAEFALDVK